jgi:hypothetical protein
MISEDAKSEPPLLVCTFWGMQMGPAKKLVCRCSNEIALDPDDDWGGSYEAICPECFLKEQPIYVGDEGACQESERVFEHMRGLVRRFREMKGGLPVFKQ